MPGIKKDSQLEIAGAVVLTVEQVAEIEHRQSIQRMAHEIQTAAIRTGLRTIELCKYIREQNVEKSIVRFELLAAGMHKAFVSEVQRVAMVPDELWKEYSAGAIGFKKILALDRGNVQHLLAETSGATEPQVEEGLQDAGLTEAKVVTAPGGAAPTKNAGVTTDDISKKQQSISLACKTVLLAAAWLEKNGRKPKQIGCTMTLGDGWYLKLSKEKPTDGASARSPGNFAGRLEGAEQLEKGADNHKPQGRKGKGKGEGKGRSAVSVTAGAGRRAETPGQVQDNATATDL